MPGRVFSRGSFLPSINPLERRFYLRASAPELVSDQRRVGEPRKALGAQCQLLLHQRPDVPPRHTLLWSVRFPRSKLCRLDRDYRSLQRSKFGLGRVQAIPGVIPHVEQLLRHFHHDLHRITHNTAVTPAYTAIVSIASIIAVSPPMPDRPANLAERAIGLRTRPRRLAD